jgi:catechol 2,3-dioxygenase-like lactoylglutathione lyase family enzyme
MDTEPNAAALAAASHFPAIGQANSTALSAAFFHPPPAAQVWDQPLMSVLVPRLIPELICSDLGSSLAFYRLLGFAVSYSRPGERFAYLSRDGADLMLEQPAARDRLYPRAELTRPYGRGVNLSIDVDDVDEIHATVVQAGHELFLPLEERWYDRADDAVGVRQFAVQDPDGYLLRLTQSIGTRPLP